MSDHIIDLLYQSFDRELSEDEVKQLEAALSDSAELRDEKARIEKLRNIFADAPAEKFSPYFAQKVMNKIKYSEQPDSETEHFMDELMYVFRRIAFVGAACAIFLLAYNFIVFDQISLSAIFGIPEVTLEEITEPIFVLR